MLEMPLGRYASYSLFYLPKCRPVCPPSMQMHWQMRLSVVLSFTLPAGLDSDSALALMELLSNLAAKGRTVSPS